MFKIAMAAFKLAARIGALGALFLFFFLLVFFNFAMIFDPPVSNFPCAGLTKRPNVRRAKWLSGQLSNRTK